MEKYRILSLLLVFLISHSVYCNESITDNADLCISRSINMNILGDVSFISLNYEQFLLFDTTSFLSGKLGIGYNMPIEIVCMGNCGPPSASYLTIPHHITRNIGNGKRFLEFGLGGTVLIGGPRQPYYLYGIFGYRYMPFQFSKVNVRIFVHLPFTSSKSEESVLWGQYIGLSIGRNFR